MRMKWVVILAALVALGVLLPTAAAQKADPSSVTVQGGAPWVRFEAARDLTGPRGEAASAGGGLVAMAAGDYDRDGVKDLVCASASGQLSLWKGNADVFHPFEEAAQRHRAEGTYTDSPFVLASAGYNLPINPDFLGSGDFNGDGNLDVVAASTKDRTLYMVPGDGRGGFGPYQSVDLPGKLKAIAVGEVNRADGLADVVVSVKKGNKGQLLVFEGPNGALNNVTPEVIQLKGPATSLALGVLPGSVSQDVAAAVGRTLYVVWGRDRKLSLDSKARARVSDPVVESRNFPKNIQSVAIGRFNGDQSPVAIAVLLKGGNVQVVSPEAGSGTLAAKRTSVESWSERSLASGSVPDATQILAARVSSRAGDDAVLLSANQVTVLEGNKARRENLPAAFSAAPTATTLSVSGGVSAVLPMRLNQAALKGLVLLKNGATAPTAEALVEGTVYTVNVTTDNDPTGMGEGDPTTNTGDLRWCINAANANEGLDTIRFAIPEPPGIEIDVTYGFYWPDITDPVILDGTSQPGYYYGGALGGAITIGGTGFYVDCGGSTIMGFEIWTYYSLPNAAARYPQAGGASQHRTAAAGRTEQDPVLWGVILEENGGNVVQSIFTTAGFLWDEFPNTFIGIGVYSPENQIGGTYVADRNVLSNNTEEGVEIYGEFATDNLVQGNWIGPSVTGKNALGNGWAGVGVGAANNTIGGTDYGAGNVISGEFWYLYGDYGQGSAEVYPGGDTFGVIVQSWAWVDGPTGSSASKGPFGALKENPRRIHDRLAAAGKGTGKKYVPDSAGRKELDGEFGGNLVQQNIIGLDPSGTQTEGLYYGYFGLYVGVYSWYDVEETVGGTSPLARNVVSSNFVGVNFTDGYDCLVQGNYIGTDITGINHDGMNYTGNMYAGVLFDYYEWYTEACTVGGTAPGAGNVISGNGLGQGAQQAAGRTEQGWYGVGVLITGSGGCTVQGNLIGTDADGLQMLPNAFGIVLDQSGNNLIGGTDEGAGNVVSGNFMDGMYFEYTGGDIVQGNLVGTDITGLAQLGNGWDGIYLHETGEELIGVFPDVVVGFPSAGANVISGNYWNGVEIEGQVVEAGRAEDTSENLVVGNFIGTDAAAQEYLGNNFNGVYINTAYMNSIEWNVIAHNNENGVYINGGLLPSGTRTEASASDHNLISQNSIYDNDSKGISLMFGANNGQGYPSLTSALSTGSGTTINGTVSGFAPSSDFTLEFFDNPTCDPSGYGEGMTYIGSQDVTTDGTGGASFSFDTASVIPAGDVITSTATDTANNTSEFSACVAVIGCPAITLSPSTLPDGEAGTPYGPISITASGGTGPYTYAVTAGTLPDGLTLDPDGTLHGTPTAGGTYVFTVTATDDLGCTGELEYTLVTGCPTITIDPATLPGAIKGTPYSQTLTASGGTAPYTYAVTAGALPPGLTLDPNTGVISGTPTVNGSYSFTVTATDDNGCIGSQEYSTFAVFGYFFYDDNGRSQFCGDPASGAFAWNVLTGGAAGNNYYGIALVFNNGTKFVSQVGSPITFSVLYDPVRHMAKGWLITENGVYVPLTDSNTLDNVGGCF